MNGNSSKTTLLRGFMPVFVLSFLYGCQSTEVSNKKDTKKPATSNAVPYKKPPSTFNDTLIINRIAAVFYNPDSLQLNKIKAITKKEFYETEVHNCFYLMRNARMVMKKYWPHIKIIESSEYRYLLFIKADHGQTCIDLDSEEDMCGILLFDRKKEPELVDMMNIDTALGFYFKPG